MVFKDSSNCDHVFPKVPAALAMPELIAVVTTLNDRTAAPVRSIFAMWHALLLRAEHFVTLGRVAPLSLQGLHIAQFRFEAFVEAVEGILDFYALGFDAFAVGAGGRSDGLCVGVA